MRKVSLPLFFYVSWEALNKSAAAPGGSFAVTFRFENLEMHKGFLRFSNPNLHQNLSLTALADLFRASLEKNRNLCNNSNNISTSGGSYAQKALFLLAAAALPLSLAGCGVVTGLLFQYNTESGGGKFTEFQLEAAGAVSQPDLVSMQETTA